MVDLVALSPCHGLLPITRGDVTLSEVDAGVITSVMPFKGEADALSAALEAAHEVAFPEPNRATGTDGARCVWTGRGQAMLLGPAPDARLSDHAALTDQSDAWAVVRIDGPRAEAVLARLVPLDLRKPVFGEGHTARSLLQHMTVSITRVGENAFQIMAFRSMAGTLVHDLDTAMSSVAARAGA
ncbi:sarcosine oxidase subunit gamma [Thalassococcus sp. BH17M4-6]|uniref:sarcosine oxidase subunit gamma n=1 Tax=Thalassococcus sp. BH17M4-6 TaxID=3413148 RepID=UPI003BD167F3